MNGAATSHGKRNTRTFVWLSIGVGLFGFIAANAHLLYVAVSSQPDCVAHVRHGEGNGSTSFSAATSSCSLKSSVTPKAQVESSP